jgi:hypothetical protein
LSREKVLPKKLSRDKIVACQIVARKIVAQKIVAYSKLSPAQKCRPTFFGKNFLQVTLMEGYFTGVQCCKTATIVARTKMSPYISIPLLLTYLLQASF